jgi:hypothetical protein
VFRIHDILGWIRIFGSMLLTNGSGSGSCYFHHRPLRCQQFFLLIKVLKVHLHHFSKIKSQKESQNRRNQGFTYYFCIMIEGSGSVSIPLTSGFGSGRPKTCGSIGSGSSSGSGTLYCTKSLQFHVF